jgi:hypothetical protein
MSSIDQRPSSLKLHGLGNTHQQQDMVPPSQHFQHYSNTNTSFVDTTTDSTMQHETKRRRITIASSVTAQSIAQDDIHLETTATTTPHEHKAKKGFGTFAPKIATYSTLPQQHGNEDDHQRKQQHSTTAPSATSRNMPESEHEPTYSGYPRMRGPGLSIGMAVTQHHIAPSAFVPRASNLAHPKHSLARCYIVRAPCGTVATFPLGPRPRMYSPPMGCKKPASLLPLHPLGKRAGAVVVPPNAPRCTKRRAH